ncbi:cytochrome c biogenesis protein CcdA, partial [Acinetobacter baumannii]
SLPLVLGAFLLLGLGLAFTPCVLPMLPILSAIIAGDSRADTRRGFLLALSYVLGMSLMYTLAGLLIAGLGAAANLSALLQKPAVL